ncbi:kelch-like [Perkinsus chesapeaki]|uniref:Kelch-like n=1 Tax=Perkinsus chesapeaki TaxID=330153 RepID=A0A7J6L628_PERCH|nr:kelch-like [Perkinsus chesapeaki]
MSRRRTLSFSDSSVRNRWVDRNGAQAAVQLILASKHNDPKACPISSIPSDVIIDNILPFIHFDQPVRNCIFVCGGRSSRVMDSNRYLSTVEVYDDYTRKWSRAPPMRNKRVGAAAMAVGDELYVVGGYRAHPDQPLGCVEVYNPWLNRWKRLPSAMQIPRFGHSLAVVGDRYLYAIGGDSRRQLVSEVEIFDTHTDEWLQPRQSLSLPRPLAGGRVIEKDGLLYIVGGDVGSSPLQFSDLIYVLDTTTTPHAWSVLSVRLSVGRSACAVAWLDESKSAIGVFGGYVVIDGDFKEVSTSEVVSLDSAHLVPLDDANSPGRVMPAIYSRSIPEMPSTRAGCRAVTVGSRVILVGGENPVATDTFEVDDSVSDSVSSPASERSSSEPPDILADLINHGATSNGATASMFAQLVNGPEDQRPDSPGSTTGDESLPHGAASIDEAVTRAMHRYFTLVHSTRPNAEASNNREREAAARLLQEITRALRIQAAHARRLTEPVRVVHDKPLVFDSAKWQWVDEQALFAGRTAAAISVGSAFPTSYGCLPRRLSSRSLTHCSKRSRVECTPSSSARRR